jgi:hypothetical protein
MIIWDSEQTRMNSYSLKENFLERQQKENLKDIGIVFLAKNYTVR